MSCAASVFIHSAILLALLPQRCSLPVAASAIPVELVRLADLPQTPPEPPNGTASSADPAEPTSPAGTPETTPGRPVPDGPAPAGFTAPISVGQSPRSHAETPSDIDKPPPPGGEALAADGSGAARSGLPFQVLTSRGDSETTVPETNAPAQGTESGGQAEQDQRSAIEDMLRQRLTEYGAMLNGRMRWQLTGKLPGVSPFTIVITIEPDGTISSAEVTQSTGSKEVDQAALQRVLALSPLPPPPFRLEGLQLKGRAFPQK
jgi:TonB family protein